ncbi:Rv0361 family membrane protein [Nocardia sp. Marseille-Q1738]
MPAPGADAKSGAAGAPNSRSTPGGAASDDRTQVIKRDQLPSASSGRAAKEAAARDQPEKGKPAPGADAKSGADSKNQAPAQAGASTSAGTAADASDAEAKTAAIPQNDPSRAGGDAATVVMRKPPSAAGPKAAEPTESDEQNPPGSDDVTMAMPVVDLDDAKTVALPIQRPADGGRAGTDRVVAPAAGPVPITKPPSTPRPAGGPKQPGPHGPSAPPQHGPGVEETRPSPHRSPGAPRQVATAPSPADVQQTVPAQSLAGPRPPQPRPIPQPQRIAPPPQPGTAPSDTARSNRRLLVLGAAAVLVVALVAVIVALVTTSGNNSPEEQVRATITDYTDALKTGDLATLRSTTCGPLHDFYQGIPDDQFAGVHKLSVERKNIPVVDSIDAIRVTDDTAIAQATVYTEADPAKRSQRTFDLQRTGGGWKVCDPPSGTQ